LPALAIAAEESGPTFSKILNEHTRRTFEAVKGYVEEHPDAADAEAARTWLFATAIDRGYEKDAVKAARNSLDKGDSAPAAALARHVLGVGLARSGKLDEGVRVLEEQLKTVRLRSPNATLDFATAMAAQAGLANEFDTARAIYERVATAYFLNTGVRQFCDNRLAKLGLIGSVAPAIDVSDLKGKPVKLSDLKGRVVLVDFWATNCPPCLEEFPRMKELYAEYHEKGFEIVGLSLDEDRATVQAFQKQWQLPWRLVFDREAVAALRRSYKVPTIPSLFLVDGNGKIVQADLNGADLRAAVKSLLEK
jgi:peroxiredoxin